MPTQNLSQTLHPFGMVMPGRSFNGGDYRYGFNGKENDDEVKGTGNSLDFGARIYDSRLGRFLSIDPDFNQYPDWSPYVFALDNPIRLVDIDGRGPGDAIQKVNHAANQAANEYWKKSFNENKTIVQEWSFVITEKQTVINLYTSPEIKSKIILRNFKTTNNSSGVTPNYNIPKDEKLIGEFHTHPYSQSEGLLEGVAFSGADINSLRENVKNDFVSLLEAGNKRFALVITDEEKAKEFYKNNSQGDIQKAWNGAFKAAEGSFQDKVKTAVSTVLGSDSGIAFYESDDKKEKFTQVKQTEGKK